MIRCYHLPHQRLTQRADAHRQQDRPGRIVVIRLRWHQPTRDYLARRTRQGKSKPEIIRCLKRYVAREVFAVLKDMNSQDPTRAA